MERFDKILLLEQGGLVGLTTFFLTIGKTFRGYFLNDTLALKRKLDYYEKILLEKEVQLRIALDQIELLKKTNSKKENQQK